MDNVGDEIWHWREDVKYKLSMLSKEVGAIVCVKLVCACFYENYTRAWKMEEM